MKRAYLTEREKASMIEAQGGLCGCGCGQTVDMDNGEGEHFVCVFFGNEEKPDAVWRADCHKPKTAEDKKKIAKVKRILRKAAGTWRPNRKKIAQRTNPWPPKGSRKIPIRKMEGSKWPTTRS